MQRYEISIDDPPFFESPNGSNKILAAGLGFVIGSPRYQVARDAYLLETSTPLLIDGEQVNQILVTPRYVGEALDSIVKSEGIVNISRVKPGMKLKEGDEYGGFDFEYWAIGSIRLIS